MVAVAIGIDSFDDLSGSNPVFDAIAELLLAAVIGIVIGGTGRYLLIKAVHSGTTSDSAQKLFVLAIALSAFFVTAGLGGSGFIGAFVAGIAFGVGSNRHAQEAIVFTENWSSAWFWYRSRSSARSSSPTSSTPSSALRSCAWFRWRYH